MKIIISLIPVFLFLVVLLYLDSFKLVSKKLLAFCLLWGLVSAAASYFLNTWLITRTGVSFSIYAGYVAPVVEEVLKCSFIWMLIRRNKVGFMIDGAIYGFAIGAAFSFAENLFYLWLYAGNEGSMLVWLTRGFGTAVMHSGTTAIFGILCMGALNRQSGLALASAGGLTAAILIHTIFNQFIVSPVAAMLIILLLVPGSIILIFSFNERSIRTWLELEFDTEAAMLRMIRKGQFARTKTGMFLVSVREHFTGEVVLDMYCFISLYLELSIRAKTLMMLKENDLEAPADPELPARIRELKALERSIGRGGCLAIAPVLRMSRKDLFIISMLDQR